MLTCTSLHMSAITNRFRKNPKNPMKKSTTAVATYAHGGIRSPGGHWSGPGTIAPAAAVVVVPVATMMTGMRNPLTLWPLTLLGEVADVAAELPPVGLLPVGLVVTAVVTPRLANITPTTRGWRRGGRGGGTFLAVCFHWPSAVASGGGLYSDYVAP